MADLTITADDVSVVKSLDESTGPAAEALTAGQYARLDTSSGAWTKGNATSTSEVGARGGIAIKDAATNITVTILHKGLMDIGDALDSLSFGDAVYLSDTDGTLADSAGTVSTVVGHVVSGWGYSTADKLLFVNA